MIKKAIFWDNDGILVDTEKYYFQSTREQLALVGVDLTSALYREYLLTQSCGAWHLAREKGVSDDEVAQLVQARNKRYGQLISQEDPSLPGVQEVLERLNPHFQMGIVTSSRPEHFKLIHEQTNFLSFMDFVITNEDYAKSKPDPEPYLLALERTGLLPEQCVVIEDSLRGLKSAQAANIDCWVIPTGLSQDSDFSGASKNLKSIADVPAMLLG